MTDRDSAAPLQPDRAPADRMIGPYRVLRQLGSGGMGEVFLAERRDQILQTVAVKVIRLGLDTADVLSRFERERQTLARMNHDNVARVYDAGVSLTGRPYFVMEYVPGERITDYCDRRKLRLVDRLQLFRQVCAGVQHAHQKGIVHRDLKPGNILVSEHQGLPTAKIIDFGLAKSLASDRAERTIVTVQGQIVGTPAYMAPEQASDDIPDVDTRADVYSLGVILYELLVGAPPFEPDQLARAGMLEVQRILREVDPPRPSARVAMRSAASDTAATSRSVSSTTLSRSLRGDLDWITVKAMEKDRNRRYGAISELAEDVRRFLEHEPVSAGPPSAGYRLRKLAQRYRSRFVLACAVILTALIGGTVAFVYGQRAIESEHRALAAKTEFDQLASLEELQRLRARQPNNLPAWPDNHDAIAAWLRSARAVADSYRNLDAVIASLRERARKVASPHGEPSATERIQHLKLAELTRPRSDAPPLPRSVQDLDSKSLNELAYFLAHADADRPRILGAPDLGLALARRALERSLAGDVSVQRDWVLDTLAWASLACGRDAEAITYSKEAIQIVGAAAKPEYSRYLDAIERRIAERPETIAALTRSLTKDEGEVWSWERPEQQVLGDALARALDQLEDLSHDIAAEENRLSWSLRVEPLSLTSHAQRWREAAAAIAQSDGITAAEAYGGLQLAPQMGLVPIGMDPSTRLWLFYHLRSARDPESVPAMDPVTGSVAIGEDTGIVFVLLPPGHVWLGAQSTNEHETRYDAMAEPQESPPHPALLDAFFLARHELTKAQWARISLRADPSFYRVGEQYADTDPPITYRHPVDSVGWSSAREALRANGLDLPTEAQWEYACRAGSDSSWASGDDPAALGAFANLRDLAFGAAKPGQDGLAPFDDGVVMLAEVGSLRPNAFGLYDLHGNLFEWCRDDMGPYTAPLVIGTGERLVADGDGTKVARGGSYNSSLAEARCSARLKVPPDLAFPLIGLRAMRSIRN